MESGPPGGSPLLPEVLSDLDPLPGSEQEVWKDGEIQTKYDSDSTRSRSLKLSFSFLACETEVTVLIIQGYCEHLKCGTHQFGASPFSWLKMSVETTARIVLVCEFLEADVRC